MGSGGDYLEGYTSSQQSLGLCFRLPYDLEGSITETALCHLHHFRLNLFFYAIIVFRVDREVTLHTDLSWTNKNMEPNSLKYL